MNAAEKVKSILQPMAEEYHLAAEVICPLMVWDSKDASMGVQIKAPKMMGDHACEMTVGFVLAPQEYKSDVAIRARGAAAILAFRYSFVTQIRRVKQQPPKEWDEPADKTDAA